MSKTHRSRTHENLETELLPEDQLRLIAVQNPCLSTEEIVVMTNARSATAKNPQGSNRSAR